MLMVVNHDSVGTHRAAALGDATIDHHLAVDARGVSLHHKLTGFEGDIVCRLDHHGFDTPELASPLADVVLNKTQAASCTQWSVTNGGTDE